jgi:hypothetical protein
MAEKTRVIGSFVVGALVSVTGSAQADDDRVCSIGFETPPYVLGLLDGQQGWEVEPDGRTAIVREGVALGGTQSLELIDVAECGYATLDLGTPFDRRFLVGSFAALIPEAWGSFGGGPECGTVHMRLELMRTTEYIPERWTVDMGLIMAGPDYGWIPAGKTAVFLDITRTHGDLVEHLAFEYELVDFDQFCGDWHVFELRCDTEREMVCLLVDWSVVFQKDLSIDADRISSLELCNARWTTDDGASVFFDQVGVRATDEFRGDVDGDGIVGVDDLVQLLGAWGICVPDDPANERPPSCPEDLDGNGVVDVSDLLILLTAWGHWTCGP